MSLPDLLSINLTASGGGGGAVTSVNGQTGDVLLTTDDIPEGSTNQYFAGTPLHVAGFNAFGQGYAIPSWTINTFNGLDELQAPVLTDGGLSQPRILNSRTLQYSQTNNQTTDINYAFLDLVDLTGTFSYNGYTHTETAVTQSGQSNLTAEVVLDFKRLNLGQGGTSSSTTSRAMKGQVRTGSGHTATNIIPVEAQILMDGGSVTNEATTLNTNTYIGGTAEYVFGLRQVVQNAGTVNQVQYGFNQEIYTDVGASTNTVVSIGTFHNGTITGNYSGLNIGSNGVVGGVSYHVTVDSTLESTNDEIGFNFASSGDAGNNKFAFNVSLSGTVAGSTNGININDQTTATAAVYGFNYTRSGTTGNGLYVINTNVQNTGSVTGDFRHFNLYAEATVSQNGGFLNGIQNGDVTGNWTGIAQTIGADIGQGLNFHNNVLNNSAAITGDVFGHAISIDGSATVTGRIRGVSLNNQAPAEGVEGFSISNSADLTDNFRGVFIQETGDSRTKTGVDITMSGAVTDDAQGVRVNVTGLVMASQRAVSGSFDGGSFGVQGQMTPFNSLGVDVGNNITMTSTVQSGSPLTGTDQLIQLFQSNLIVNDDISTGPFGLNTTMIAMPSQVAVASGKTVPLLRSMLLGTTVPSGSGGTITEHIVLEILGLPSFGGSVSCPSKTAIQDSQLLGANFSDGTTEAWFVKNNDPNTENHLSRLAIGTTNKKVSASTVGLEVYNKDILVDTGFLIAGTAGYGLKIKEGTNAKMGTATLIAGTVTVANTSVTANSRIFVEINVPGGTLGTVYVNNIVASTSFDIVSTSVLDTSTVAWLIVEAV